MSFRFTLLSLFICLAGYIQISAQVGTCSDPYAISLNADESVYLYEIGSSNTFLFQHCSGDPSPEIDFVYSFAAPEDGILYVNLRVPKLASIQSQNEVLTIKTNCSTDDTGLIDCVSFYDPREISIAAGNTVYLIIEGGVTGLFYALEVGFTASSISTFCEGTACSSISCQLFSSATIQGQTDGSCSFGNTDDYGCVDDMGGPDYVYQFYMDAEQEVYFDLNSPSELYVMVMDECSPDATCLDYFSSTEGGKVITIPAGGAYLVIDGADLQGANYTLSYNCNTQPPQASDCTPDPAFTDFYQNDAEVLAALQMINDPTYASTIEIPADLFDFYYERLNAIFNATEIPERDTVVECLNIHNSSDEIFTKEIGVDVIPGFTDWANDLINGIYPTSNTQVNNLINEHNLLLTSNYQTADNWSLGIASDHHLNTQALANAFALISGVINTDIINVTIFCNNDGIGETSFSNYVDINFFMAIPCVDGVSWQFRVYDDCSVQFLNREGNDTEPILCDNGFQCATDPLCLPWMQDTLDYYVQLWNTSCNPPFSGTFLNIVEDIYGNQIFELSGIPNATDSGGARYYNCDGQLLGFSSTTIAGTTYEPQYLENYGFVESLWSCEEELPNCSGCSSNIDDILCFDWVQDRMYQTPEVEEIATAIYDGQEVITIGHSYCPPGVICAVPGVTDIYNCDGNLITTISSQIQEIIELSGSNIIYSLGDPLPPCYDCPINSNDILCLPWVQNYINTNYTCTPDVCGGVDLYTSPSGECAIDFIGEITCFLTVCPPHEVFDIEGNIIATYGSECGLEGLGYTNRQSIWTCTQSLPDCNPISGATYTLTPQFPTTPPCTGETFCVPFTLNDFTRFTGSVVDMSWDADVLVYQSVGNLNTQVAELDISDFDLSAVGNGKLILDWEFIPCNQSQMGDGITLSDGEVFFELCFIAIGGNGQSTSFELAPAPTSYAYRGGVGCAILDIGIQPNLVETCGEGLSNCPVQGIDILCQDWVTGYINSTLNFFDCETGNFEVQLYEREMDYIIDFIHYDYLNTCPSDIHALYNCTGTRLDSVYIPAEPGCFQSGNLSLLNGFELVETWNCSEGVLPNCADAPWPVPDCNAGLNIHFINTVWDDFSSDIDGTPLTSGDWIGLFYLDDNGVYVCTDAVQIADPVTDFSLQACGDDPLTSEKDGFVSGEVFHYKVLKNGQEYQPIDLYPDYYELGYFTPSFPNALNTFEGNLRTSALKELTTQIWPPVPPDCANATPINCGDIYTNHTNSAGLRNAEWYNCSDNVLNGPEVVYEFINTNVQDVKITMSNLENDLELYLFDECDQYNCMAKSERSGTNDEVILVQGLSAGTFYIIVEGYYGYESTYNIALECGDFPQGDFTCAPELINCGNTISGTTNGACSEVNFYDCGEAYVSGPELVYAFSVDVLSQITATLEISDNVDLDLFLLNDLDPNACIAYSNQGGITIEQLLLDVIPGLTYYLVVDGFNGAQGAFNLTLSCNPYIPCDNPPCPPPPPEVDCEDLPEIICGQTIEDTNANGYDQVETWGSCSGIVTGKEVVYRFSNPVDQYIRIELWDFTENLNVYMLDDCPTGGCILAGDKSGLIPEAIQKPILPAGEYVIAVDGFAGAESDFKLKITCENTFVPCLEIPIVTGENYISSNRVPIDLNMKEILNGTADFVDVIIDEYGAEVYNNMPNSAPNNNEWDITDGYKILASGDGIVKICGEAADSTLAIEVIGFDNDGFQFNNYIPYLYQESHLVSEAFTNTEGLGAAYYLSPSGTVSPYFFPINGPEDYHMEGGKGYILQVDVDGTFTYRNSTQTYIPNGCQFFRTPIRQTFHHSIVKMEQSTLEDWLTPGDEIGFFNSEGILCGSAQYNGYDVISVLQADQPNTEVVEGYPELSEFYVKIWHHVSGKTKEVSIQFQNEESLFSKGTIYLLESLSVLNSTTILEYASNEWKIFPNPASKEIFIELALIQKEGVTIDVLSINGQAQLSIPLQQFEKGYHTIPLDLSKLISGTYLVRLTHDSGTSIKKLILEK